MTKQTKFDVVYWTTTKVYNLVDFSSLFHIC